MTTVENRYLAGNFAPVRDELSVTDLEVEGSIPPALSGRLIRNGPNPIAPDPGDYHWFLGNGMLHAIELRDGKAVSYRNRWVRTDDAAALLGEEPIPGQPDDVFIGGATRRTRTWCVTPGRSSRSSRCASRPRCGPTCRPSAATTSAAHCGHR